MASMNGTSGPITGRTRSTGLRPGGSALESACRTIRRCTLSFSATPLMVPTPNSYSLRICSNNSTFALLSIPASCLISRMPRLKEGGPIYSIEVGRFTVSKSRASELLKGKALTATIDLRTPSSVNENGKVEASGAYFKNPQGGFGQYYRGPLLEMALIVQHEQNAWPDVRLTNYAGRQIADVIDRQKA